MLSARTIQALGNLEAKRTSTNPNAAALVVHLLYQAGVRPGDRIAVNCSGSFPALILSVLCAMDAMELDGTVFCSVGASTYGADLEENIRSRIARYGSVSCFVNVGGNLASTGGSPLTAALAFCKAPPPEMACWAVIWKKVFRFCIFST